MTTKTNEIKEILKFWLLPWPTRKQNIRMWSIVVGSWILAWWAFGLCWVLMTSSGVASKLAWVVVLAMTFYTSLAVLGDQMLRGAKARATSRQAAINEAMRVAVEALLKHNADGLRKMVGRDVAQNPISMTAATLEAGEKLESTVPTNPLQAALQGDEEAFDEMLADDEDDNKLF